MKKIKFLLIAIFMFAGCDQNSTNVQKMEIPTNGFFASSDHQVMMGSSVTVEIFKKIDKAWADRDYETLKSYIHEKPWMHFANGDIANSPQEFVDLIEKEYQDFQASNSNWGWKTNYAYSVKQTKSENPEYKNQEGEWVNARFTSEDATYEEWYYIVDGKIQTWQQAKRLKAKRMALKK